MERIIAYIQQQNMATTATFSIQTFSLSMDYIYVPSRDNEEIAAVPKS